MSKINIFALLLLINLSSLVSSDLLDLSIVTDLVKQINGLTGGLWKADVTKLSLLSKKDQLKLCGCRIPEKKISKEAEPPHFEAGATGNCTYKIDFDARTKWPSCAPIINHIQDQGQCGSCWAVATASAYTDRLCTGTDYKLKNGCKPYPYSSFGSAPRQQCKSACTSTSWKTPYTKDKNMATTVGRLIGDSATVMAIQKEIQTNGPVVAGFTVYSDLMSYKSGVYFKTPNAQKREGHAVVIIGWGTQTCDGKKMDFWLIKNSWGEAFGEKGYFKMRRGVNECGIEKDEISFGIPKI
uniref:Pept_C1 domain-containing protein n=1 Tax=Meloidogyne hapla TaxID=6305 RepID=A0A1I8BD56_MELHA